MKFAVLGTDSDIVQLVVAAREMEHEVVWLGDVRSEDREALGLLVVDFKDLAGEWELLLSHGVVDAVLVGRGTENGDVRAEKFKRLVTEAVPVIAVHPIFESVLPYYEIDMTRRETGAIVHHFNPNIVPAVLADLAAWVREGHPTVGAIHQVTCERGTAGPSRSAVLSHLARDVEMLAAIAGDIRRVSAIGPATADASFASLQVQMTATNVSSVRWSVGAAGHAGIRITLLGERGTVTLFDSAATDGESLWQLETATDDRVDSQTFADAQPAHEAIQRLTDAISKSVAGQRSAASTWETATRDMEVVDAVELSLQKGRTIEVFQQRLTEQLAFRGTMAAIGCGLLLVVFVAVLGLALLGGAEGAVQQKLAPAWPLLLLAVLAFFLLLQAIPILAQKRPERNGEPPPSQ
jgi:hypothetical protein